jgi:hypothetical protein
MTRTLASLILVLSVGCSLVNAPDRNLTPPDGGVDGGGIELFCDDGLDDDNDMAADCDDSDCDEEPACCERRATTLSESWQTPNLASDWVFAPTEGDPWNPTRQAFEGSTFVGGFAQNDAPRALLSRDCVSLALGGWVTTTLRATESEGCEANETCDAYAGIVLTVASDLAVGERLPDEIAVTLDAGGLVLVTQADVEFARTRVPVGENVDVQIELRPSLDDADQPMLIGSVTVGDEPLLADFRVSAIEDLVSIGDCAEIPGLFMAAQGQGDLVYVGPIEAARQDCANPSQFDEQSATLRASNLDFGPSWVEAYIGSPALASSRSALSDIQWDLIVEGSNWGPELEASTHVGYALGHARVAVDEGGNWRLTGWQSSGKPKVGDDPPACAEPSCEQNRSVREPHLLAELGDGQELRDLVLSFARELVPDPTERDLFGIQIVRPAGGPLNSIPLSNTATLSPDDVPECISLRDPALIPVDPDALGGYWLLFTCVEGAQPPREIHAVRISRALEVVREAGEPMRNVVLRAADLGPFAAGGIRSAEPVISFEDQGMRLRIWFLAQRNPGDWAVALAEARTHDATTLEFDLPEPVPFPVNPILTNDSTLVLSGCLAEECSITGIAVTPRADDPSRLRFLLARRLKMDPSTYTDQLIPLEQTWTRP